MSDELVEAARLMSALVELCDNCGGDGWVAPGIECRWCDPARQWLAAHPLDDARDP